MSQIDIRLAVGVEDHPKVKKLVRRCGESAWRCLTRLWGQVRLRFPATGIMSGWSIEDIELAAGWPQGDGMDGLFVGTLIELGFIETWSENDDEDSARAYAIHDWIEEQPYAIESDQRSARARDAGLKSGEARLRKKLEESGHIVYRDARKPGAKSVSLKLPAGESPEAEIVAQKGSESVSGDQGSQNGSNRDNSDDSDVSETSTSSETTTSNIGRTKHDSLLNCQLNSLPSLPSLPTTTTPDFSGDVDKSGEIVDDRIREFQKLAVEWRRVSQRHNQGWPDDKEWNRIKHGWVDAIRLLIERDGFTVEQYRKVLSALDTGAVDSKDFSWIANGCKSPIKLRKRDADKMRYIDVLLRRLNVKQSKDASVTPLKTFDDLYGPEMNWINREHREGRITAEERHNQEANLKAKYKRYLETERKGRYK